MPERVMLKVYMPRDLYNEICLFKDPESSLSKFAREAIKREILLVKARRIQLAKTG